MSWRGCAVWLTVAMSAWGCSSEQVRDPGTKTVALPADADRHLRNMTEISADEIEIVLPKIYRGACSVVCDPEVQERRITPTRIELTDSAGLGIPPLSLQVVQMRLLARRSIRATFDDEQAQSNRQLVKLSARGKVKYRGAEGTKEATSLMIRNAELTLTP